MAHYNLDQLVYINPINEKKVDCVKVKSSVADRLNGLGNNHWYSKNSVFFTGESRISLSQARRFGFIERNDELFNGPRAVLRFSDETHLEIKFETDAELSSFVNDIIGRLSNTILL